MRTLLIACPRDFARARTAVESHADAEWVFFDPDYTELLKWERTLTGAARYRRIGKQLNETALRLRQPFLDLIAELGRRFDSLSWWTSRLSERNPMVSPLFLRCCYLAVASELLRSLDVPMLMVSRSAALLEAIAREGDASGWSIQRVGTPRVDRRPLLPLARTLAFLWRSGTAKRGPAPRLDGEQEILLRTWLDDASFGDDGSLRDRYFDGLAAWLRNEGMRVTILPVFFNVRRRDVWEWLESNDTRVLDPRRLLRPADYVAAIRTALGQRRFTFDRLHLAGVEVTALFEEESRATLMEAGTLEAALSASIPKRLAARGDRVQAFIDLFENMITEKPMILGFRRHSPETRLVAFQHGIPAPLLVSIFVSSEEARFAPIPDKVITNGEFFSAILVAAGLPADRVASGPALRYQYLADPKNAPAPSSGDAVLVALPLEEREAIELLIKSRSALEGIGVPVLVKPHPMSDFEPIRSAAGPLPQGFVVSGGAMADVLPRVRVVVTLGSSAAFESAAAGMMVVVVGREAALDLNPIQWFPEFDRTFYSPDEIRTEVRRILEMPDAELAAIREQQVRTLRGAFRPVDDASLGEFLVH